MDLNNLLLALPVFYIAYQGIGLYWDSQGRRAIGRSLSRPRTSSTLRAMRELTGLGAKLGFNKAILLRSKKLNERLYRLLLRSGFPFGWNAEDFLFIKELGICLAALVLWRTGADQPLLWALGPFLGFWLPDVYLKSKGSARMAAIQRQLPGFVDLAALALESGMDLLPAIERILEKLKPSALREELQTLLQETRLGTPRKETFQNLSFRVDLSDVRSLSSMIIQSEELGTSLAGVLRNYAEDMRNRRILRAEEIAGKAPVKLLFPMMVFFFPIVFVVIFGPLALNFMSSYK